MQRIRPVLVALAVAAPVAAAAQQSVTLDPVVVTATRSPLERARTGSSVSVLTAEDIAENPAPTLNETLDRLPGVSIATRGGPGTAASVSVRGSNLPNLVVRVDGIEITDPSQPQVAADLGLLLPGDATRIEVLKGPQSALYGGEAVGGVIEVTTARARGTGAGVESFFEAGSFETVSGGASVGAGMERWDFTVSALGFGTDGISAARNGTEEDGARNLTFSGAGSVDLADWLTVGGAARRVESRVDFDGFPAPAFTLADEDNVSETDLLAGRLFARAALMGGRLTQEVSAQAVAIDRFSDSETLESRFEGDRVKLEYLGMFEAAPAVDLIFGADWTREDIALSDTFSVGETKADSEIAGGFAQVVVSPLEDVTVTAALRLDEHSEFGDFATWRLTAAWEAAPGTVLRAAAGTGFRAPSNYELFAPPFAPGSPLGNPDLQPEETFGYEAGVDQTLLGGRAQASLTWFDSRTTDLIEYDPALGFTQQDGESERRGVEAAVVAGLTDWAELSASYTWLLTEGADGFRLQFAPRHDVGALLTLRPTERLRLGLSANYLSGVRSGTDDLDPFLLVGASAGYALTDAVEATLRVENALDQDYERVRGYGTAGVSVFAGLRARF